MSDGGTKSIFTNIVLKPIGGYITTTADGFDSFTISGSDRGIETEDIFSNGSKITGGSGFNQREVLDIFVGGRVSSADVTRYMEKLYGNGNLNGVETHDDDIHEINNTGNENDGDGEQESQTGGMTVDNLVDLFTGGGSKNKTMSLSEVINLFREY